MFLRYNSHTPQIVVRFVAVPTVASITRTGSICNIGVDFDVMPTNEVVVYGEVIEGYTWVHDEPKKKCHKKCIRIHHILQ